MANNNFLKRFLAFFSDQVFSNSIVIGGVLLLNVLVFYEVASSERHDQLNGTALIFILPIVVFDWLYNVFKDFSDGRSFGKRIAGLQVFDFRSKQPASALQTLARNLTLVLFPIECLFVLARQDGRRIGDFIAGTYVSDYTFLPARKPGLPYLLLPIALPMVLSLVLTSPLIYLVYSKDNSTWVDNASYINTQKSENASLLGKDLYDDYFKEFEVEIYEKPLPNGNNYLISIYAETKTEALTEDPEMIKLQLRNFCDGIVGDSNYNAVAKLVFKENGFSQIGIVIRK